MAAAGDVARSGISTRIPPRGVFSFIEDQSTRGMLTDAFNAIERVPGGWAELTKEAPQGFMFSPPTPIRQQIDAAILATPSGQSHSGASYGLTMRHMQTIARVGWAQYVRSLLKTAAAPNAGTGTGSAANSSSGAAAAFDTDTNNSLDGGARRRRRKLSRRRRQTRRHRKQRR